jgi:PAS domain S-box-containing protein
MVSAQLFISLIYNTSLLLVLTAIYSGIKFKIPFESALPSRTRDFLTGVLIGLIGVALMTSPWEFEPGIRFDARSILLSVTGLFFGVIPTALAVGITGAFRLFVDGAGELSGLGVIFTSAGLGLIWQHWRPDLKLKGGLFELYLFGIIVNLLMLACMFILPRPVALEVLSHISVPVMVVFPVGTVLLSILLIRQRENRLMDEKLLESKNLFENVVENVPLMIFLKEARDLRFVIFNRAGEELLGYGRKDLLGKNNLDLFPPEQAAHFMAKDREVLDGEKGFLDIPEEFIDTARKGRRILHTSKVCIRGGDGATKFLLGISEDVTERKKAESDIHDAYETQGILNIMLQQSLSPVPLPKKLTDHLATLLSIPWLAVEPKGAVFLLTGQTLTLAVQQGLASPLLAACANVPVGKCLCGRAAGSGEIVTSTGIEPEHETVYKGILPHGHCCMPIIAAGAILGVLNLYLKAGIDFTAKQRDFIRAVTNILASDILHARIEEQLSQAQKMEAVGQMAGGIAHDFNNILTAVMGYSGFLSAAIPAGDPKRADLDEIIKAGERAAVLTNQLLTFSRKQVVQFSGLNLDQIIPETIKMLRRMIPENIELRTFLKSAPAIVSGNQGQLEQVILNLAVNARDAMPDGGKLTFETSLAELDEAYSSAHPEVSPGRYVMLAVSDTGHGMSPEVARHLFEPFFTTKEQGKGTGLGLSTV